MTDIVWTPSPDRAASSLLARFMDWLPGRPAGYEELWEWSIEDRAGFWKAVWEFCGVIADDLPTRVIGEEAMPGTEWFPDVRLNFAENLLRRGGDGVAVIAAAEGRPTVQITWDELRKKVANAQAGLRRLGVREGDRVAGLLPNGEAAIVGMLATAATGAVWSSCSPDFGAGGIVDRFGQIEPKVLIAADGYRYNGRAHGVESTVREAVAAIGSIEHVVVVDFAGIGLDPGDVDSSSWQDLTARGPDRPYFARLPFDHPVYIMYSSGTTGPPKSIVHGAGGTLLKHLCEHQLHCDIRADDVVFWFTTCGWMMWNWLVSALASGATIVAYDGSPSHPDLGALWRLAAETGITHFGTSPRFLAANANAGVVPSEAADLSSIRWLGSTGAPLNPAQFDWVYENVSDDLHLASVSGGTDIIGCFAAGVPTLPVRRGELQARGLGMAVECRDEDGRSVIGRQGELVCTAPFPSMPVRFWDDPDGTKYREAYFERWPGVWTHGDYIEIRPHGGVVISGRSDTTLNPGGVRIGTAEIYRAIEGLPGIDDAIVVGHAAGGDTEVVLFVKPAPGHDLDDDLVASIESRIRAETSPRHVPRHILEVADIPYTLSGKKVEKAVRQVLAGEPVLNRDALANPEALELFEDRL